ncbi:MAG: hypothetical protein NTV40_09185 [Solirubrobacterales bacterium]|nr:hypothetical protein [Solirubrobacterales bacterium]
MPKSDPKQFQRASTRVLSIAMVLIGIVLMISTLVRGGGLFSTGVIFGLLFIAAGVARLFLLGKRNSG